MCAFVCSGACGNAAGSRIKSGTARWWGWRVSEAPLLDCFTAVLSSLLPSWEKVGFRDSERSDEGAWAFVLNAASSPASLPSVKTGVYVRFRALWCLWECCWVPDQVRDSEVVGVAAHAETSGSHCDPGLNQMDGMRRRFASYLVDKKRGSPSPHTFRVLQSV